MVLRMGGPMLGGDRRQKYFRRPHFLLASPEGWDYLWRWRWYVSSAVFFFVKRRYVMARFFGRISVVFAAAILVAALASPAQAEEVKTKYFSIDLPANWVMPQPVQEGGGAQIAIFGNNSDGSAVTITVVGTDLSAKDAAEQTVGNMRSGGLKPSDPVEKNGMYTSSFKQGPATGESWFGSNGKEFAVTTIIGNSLDSGKALLKLLKPVDAKLFPTF